MQKLLFLSSLFLLFPFVARADDEIVPLPDNPVDTQYVWSKDLNEFVVTGQGGAVSKRRLSPM